jgi:hypothetical protein
VPDVNDVKLGVHGCADALRPPQSSHAVVGAIHADDRFVRGFRYLFLVHDWDFNRSAGDDA